MAVSFEKNKKFLFEPRQNRNDGLGDLKRQVRRVRAHRHDRICHRGGLSELGRFSGADLHELRIRI